MRLVSTKESVHAGEVSLLAILETALAMAASVYIAVEFNTLTHIFLSAAIAPLLLLRTEFSTLKGLEWFYKVGDKVGTLFNTVIKNYSSNTVMRLLFAFIYIMFLSISAFITKTIVTIFGAIKHPLQSIKSIPPNWSRIALVTDIKYPPEIMPGTESTQIENLKGLQFNDLLQATKETINNKEVIILLPHSRSKCNSGDLGWGFIAQAFPGSVVNT